ncbi:hypothetical protein WNY37_17320 [Henriciella sp. AS95]|uniref:hypothetical protein n=1 Tax=Henriciella sp. AS95 TaxID=3135782 RepID=UPI0031728D4A
MTTVEAKRNGQGCLWAVGTFFGFLVFGWVTMMWLQPERLANVNHCLGPVMDVEPPLQNTCDFAINGELCLYSKTSDDICKTKRLEPGEGFDRAEIDADLARLGGLLRAETYACKLPFMPGMVEDMNTKRMKQGCLPEGETRK